MGFSTHGTLETMERFLKAYGKDMEFCQIQINWLDYHFQNAKKKVEMLREYNIPVWVMEPIRGGKLAAVTAEQEAILKQYRDETPVEWAFHFLQAIPEIAVTLSGMSNFEQLQQNIATYSEEKPLSEAIYSDGGFIAPMAMGAVPADKQPSACVGCRSCE